MPLHEPRRYNHYSRDKAGKEVLLRSFDGIRGVKQKGKTVALCGENYDDIRAVIQLGSRDWVEAETLKIRTIDAPTECCEVFR